MFLLFIYVTIVLLFPTLTPPSLFLCFFVFVCPGPFPSGSRAPAGRLAGLLRPSWWAFLGPRARKAGLTKVACRGVWKNVSRLSQGE
eukprot:9504111-Pyramimonas_sp.AAC.1